MRKILCDKRGASQKMHPLLSIAIVVGLIVAVFYIYGSVSQSIGGKDDKDTGLGEDCGINSPLTVNQRSAVVGGTSPANVNITCGTYSDDAKLDEVIVKTSVTSGTTNFPSGSKLYCLVSSGDYIDTTFTETMTCGGIIVDVPMKYATSDNPSITIKDPNNGDATVSDLIGGGVTNLTNPTAGSTVEFDVEFQGTSGEGTGDLIYIIEFPTNSAINITDVTMDNLKKVTSIPATHTLQNAAAESVAFEVPNIDGAVKKKYSIIATLDTGADLTGGVYTDWYSAQAFLDDDDTIKFGIQDSVGATAKYENTADSDFYIA